MAMHKDWKSEVAKAILDRFDLLNGTKYDESVAQTRAIVDKYSPFEDDTAYIEVNDAPIQMVDGIARPVPWSESAISRMEALGRAGVTVSIACGPCGDEPFMWSVHALFHGEECARPFAANSFEHAVEIAEIEAKKRRWL